MTSWNDGDAVLDTEGHVWTVTRYGGMVMRPVDNLAPAPPIMSAGIRWLEANHGPLKTVYRRPS